MLGYPKYKVGDKVKITLKDKEYFGEVYIVDANGTFENPDDVSYDIMVHNWAHPAHPEKVGDCLMKHWSERSVHEIENN